MKRFRYIVFCLFLVWPALIFAQFTGEAALADKYFDEQEYEQALDLYQKVHRKDQGVKHFIYRIVACHSNLGQFDDGISFLEKLIKKDEKAFDLQVLQVSLYERKGEAETAKDKLENLIYKQLESRDDFARTGSFLVQSGRDDDALATYLQGRKVLKGKGEFAQELAVVYVQKGKYGKAVEEYLLDYETDPGNYSRIKNQILYLVGPTTSDEIEAVLLEAVQQHPKDKIIRTLVFEFYVLNENFYEALVQVKSIDRVFNEKGSRVYQFALTLQNNEEYKLSNKALDYIIENYKNGQFYFRAYKEKTVNGELIAFQSIPLDTNEIREAVNNYDDLFTRFGRNASFFDAMYRKANLLAIYLNDLEGAQKELAHILSANVKTKEKAQALLLEGDILLMQKEYNKAKLKYAEVQEMYKDEQIGALAKLKDGKLSYYKGDFEIAQARLKTIKDNTSNDISNDAIKLNLLIQDNTGLDSTTIALQIYAEAQLLIFQREFDAGMKLLDSLLYEFPNHTLTDEVYWEKANIYLTRQDVPKALEQLDLIITGHKEDILADDAIYTKARIYDYNLKEKDEAMKYYMSLLRDFPGSLYSVETRKRIRELRSSRG